MSVVLDNVVSLLTFNHLLNAYICIMGLIIVTLQTSANINTRRFASIPAVLVQPAWLYQTATPETWGLFLLSLYYQVMWIKGFYVDWISPVVWRNTLKKIKA